MESGTGTYAVTIYSSKLFFPLWFVVHTHIVLEHDGIFSRYEVLGRTPLARPEKVVEGFLYKNVLPPEEGLFIICATSATSGIGPRWKTNKCGNIVGEENSVAHKMYKFFEEGTVTSYPYIHTYNMFNGPNSNTFTKWVIDQFPESNLKLPLSAWGKKYKN